jgi:hypothetical protein
LLGTVVVMVVLVLVAVATLVVVVVFRVRDDGAIFDNSCGGRCGGGTCVKVATLMPVSVLVVVVSAAVVAAVKMVVIVKVMAAIGRGFNGNGGASRVGNAC